MLPWRNYGLGQNNMVSTDQGICTWDATDESNTIKIFVSSWGRACGKGIV